jgi:hypothetical protein
VQGTTTSIGLDVCGASATLEDFSINGVSGAAGIGLLMCRYGTSDSGAHKISNFGINGTFAITGIYGVGMEETDLDHVRLTLNQNAPLVYFSQSNDLSVTSPNGTIYGPTSQVNLHIHGGGTFINYNTGANARGIVVATTCNTCSITGNYIRAAMAGIFLTGSPGYVTPAAVDGNEFETSNTTEPAILLGDVHLYRSRIVNNDFNTIGSYPDIYQINQTGSDYFDSGILENNQYKNAPSFYSIAYSTLADHTAIQVRFLSQSNHYGFFPPTFSGAGYDLTSTMPLPPWAGTVQSPSFWARYTVTKIANGVNTCANANGCWQVNGVYNSIASAALTQNITLAGIPANYYVEALRMKTATACTGATTANTGIGTDDNAQYWYPHAYNIAAAVSTSNKIDALAAPGSTDAGITLNILANLITTGSNIDQLVTGCSVDYWLKYSILP